MQVHLQSLHKQFPDGTLAVDGFTLEIADGELVALVGPSGCGKTTLLRLVAGLETPTAGTIRIGGREVNDLAPKDRDVAMVFQNHALYPHKNAYENMAFPLVLRRRPRAEIDARVRSAADLLGIGHLLRRRPEELSGGERQRVAVGRAIVRQPACFLFDEPLASLDPGLRTEMRLELRRLHAELGITTLYVTHDQEEAMTLGQRVAVMDRGRLQQVGPPMEVYRQPVNRFVAGFLGRPAMNFLDGTLVDMDGQLWLELGDQRLRVPRAACPPVMPDHGQTSCPCHPSLADRVNQPVTLGVRPEDLHEQATDRTSPLLATVEHQEPLGDRTLVYLAAGRHRLVARLGPATALRPGDAVTLHVDLDRVHTW